MTIHKYDVSDLADHLEIEMPTGAEVLCVQLQNGKPMIWARVDSSAQKEQRCFRWCGTGHSADGCHGYIGTVQMNGLVFHLFEAAAR